MKLLLLFIGLLAFSPAFAQKTKLPSDQEIAEVMKWITDHRKPTDTLDNVRYEFRKLHWMWLENEFTKEEVAYLKRQDENAPKIWEPGTVRGVVPDFNHKEGGKFYRYSTPLFTPDKKYAVIVKHFYEGNLGGEVCMLLLRRTENGWVVDRVKFKQVYCLIS